MSGDEGFDWDEALNIVQRAEESFNRGDVEAILGRYADDVVIRFAGAPEGAKRRVIGRGGQALIVSVRNFDISEY
jgi:ketosteroid isomerase-like protein